MRKIILLTFFLIMFLCNGYVFGEAWQDVTDGLTDGEFYSIAEGSPANNEIIYIGTSKGLYREQHGDEGWRRIFICRGQYKGINHICAAKDNTVYIATKNGLYESGNSGKTWKRLFRGIGKESYSTYVTFDRDNRGTIYLGTLKGLFWTQNKGDTWKKSPGILSNARINSIAIAEIADEKYLFVICNNEIYKITEDFKSYKKIFGSDSLENFEENDLESGNDNDSEDTPIFLLNDISVRKQVLYLSTNRGLFTSGDGGASWLRFNNAGLSNRWINSILITDVNSPNGSERIFAATKNGVFEYSEKEYLWNRIYRGMISTDARKLILTSEGELWALCKARIYRREFGYSHASSEKPTEADKILSNFGNEPTINETITMAIEYAEVYPEKIEKWRSRAEFRALLPKVTFGIDESKSDTYSLSTDPTRTTIVLGPEDVTTGWDINFTWDLSDLVWSGSQTTIDIRSKLMVQLRGDIVDEVTRTYFERRRLQIEFLMEPPGDLPLLLRKQLRMQELTASLDGLTGSRFSRAITQNE